MKYCKDCKYYKYIYEAKCFHEKSKYDARNEADRMVYGPQIKHQSCENMRYWKPMCGKEALLFEQKEKEKEGIIKRWLKNVFS